MTRRPNASQALALKAAAVAAAARDDEPDETPTATTAATEHEANPVAVPSPEPAAPDLEQPDTKPIGRPKGRRSVAARQTVYLDDARHAALARLADDRGRSIHSLILEGIDHVIGKPTTPGWR